MRNSYKRIIRIDSKRTSEFLRQAFDQFHGSMARPCNAGSVGEYVIEVPSSAYWRNWADKLVEEFDLDYGPNPA